MKNRIKEWRLRKGLSQTSLAQAIGEGKRKSLINKLETGKQNLTQRYMEKIADAVGCTTSELLSESAVEMPPATPEMEISRFYAMYGSLSPAARQTVDLGLKVSLVKPHGSDDENGNSDPKKKKAVERQEKSGT